MKIQLRFPGMVLGLLLFTLSAQAAQYANSENVSVQSQRGLQETQWGVELAGSGLGAAPKVSGMSSGKSISNFSMNVEFAPALNSSIGAIDVGPSFSTFSNSGSSDLPQSLVFAWTVGAGVRYQARFLSEQWIVPVVSYNVESMQYRLRSGQTGYFLAKGPTLGAYILMNSFDPSEARSLYSSIGIARTYAVFEYRDISGSGADMEMDGRSGHFGLRFEF
ncbi:hypothetical protein WDW86_15595 [Bdellovibrionota bacterium FG-2]